jgi:hypothetical protein
VFQPIWGDREAGGVGAGETREDGGGGGLEDRSQAGPQRTQTLPHRGTTSGPCVWYRYVFNVIQLRSIKERLLTMEKSLCPDIIVIADTGHCLHV